MTTGIEYTQVFTGTTSGAGTYQYFQLGNTLQTAGSIFVVKFLSISATNGIAITSPAYGVRMTTNSSNTGSGSINLLSNASSVVAANVPIILLNNVSEEAFQGKGNQVIINQNYIGVDVNTNGSFCVVISYSLIPVANPLAGNFGIFTYTATATKLNLLNNSTSSTRILKSALISNFDPSITYTTQFVVDVSGTDTGYLSPSFSVAPGEMVNFSLPFYLSPSTTLTLVAPVSGTTGGVGLSSYCSFVEEAI